MASDPKTCRLAQLIVEKHRDEALAVVIERIVGRLIVHDYALAIMWTRVAEAVHAMLPDANPEHSVWHNQSVVQEDEQRRREVHDVLLAGGSFDEHG